MTRTLIGAGMAAWALGLSAQTAPQDRVQEKVQVTVRTVVAVVTDGVGRRLASPPSIEDLEFLEGGQPAPIVGIEPLNGPAGPALETAVTQPQSLATPAHPWPAAQIAQVLYVDPLFVYRGSASTYRDTLARSLDPILARGPLRIVLAGNPPRDLVPSTTDAAVARAGLQRLPREANGLASLLEARRKLIDDSRAPLREWQLAARFAIARDIERIESSMESLELWAAQNPPPRHTILYLITDGFELDPTDFYFACSNLCPPDKMLERERFRKEFGRRIPRLLDRVSADLVSLNFLVVPITNGVPPEMGFPESPASQRVSFHETAADAVRPIASPQSRLVFQPTDPLYTVAEATGGEVVIGAGKLRQALDRFNDAYVVSYQSPSGADATAHSLELRAKRPGMVVRAARAIAGGAAARTILAHGQAMKALQGSTAGGRVGVAASLENVRKERGKTAGSLVVTADLGGVVEAVSHDVAPRARVTIAVETDDPTPFFHTEELDVKRSGEGTVWTYETPMTWPRSARRVTVLVEELQSGLFGTAAAELPK